MIQMCNELGFDIFQPEVLKMQIMLYAHFENMPGFQIQSQI